MKRKALMIFMLSALLALLTFLPARIFIPEGHYLTSQQFAMIEKIRGTLWSGQMILKMRQHQAKVLIQWKTEGSCFFSLDACFKLHASSFGHRGEATEIIGEVRVPIVSSLFRSSCLPLSGLKVSKVNGALTDALFKAFVPELVKAEQFIRIKNVNFAIDFVDGLVTEATGAIAIDPGTIQYRAINQRVTSQKLDGLAGAFVEINGGYTLSLADSSGNSYLQLSTFNSQDEFSLVVFDAFARQFGAVSLEGQAGGNPARFEISQKITDLICGQ